MLGFFDQNASAVDDSAKIKAFSQLQKDAKTKEDLRRAEMRTLSPAPLRNYSGLHPRVGGVVDRTVKLVFVDSEAFDLFCRLFSVSSTIENSCYKLDLLMALLHAVERGEIVFDPKEGKIHYA